MSQFARPDADVTTGNWSASSGSALYAMIDEATASDSDYISVYDSDGSAESCTVGLSSVDDPDDTSSHSVVVRAYTDSFYSSVTLNVALKAGSTTIKNQNFTPTTSFSNFTMSLNATEAGNIGTSGYGDLSLVITSTDSMGMMSETRVSQAYFTCPAAALNVTPTAAVCELSATFYDTSSVSITPNPATVNASATFTGVKLGVLKTIGTDVTHGTSTPTSSSGSSTYTVGFDTAVSNVAVGDKVYFDDYSQGSSEEYVYNVEAVNSTTSFDLTYVSGGSLGDVTPYGNLYAADFSQASGVFKRVFDYATPQAWIDDFNDTSIYSADDYAIGAIGAVEKFDQHLQLNCVQTNHTLGSITLTVLSHARHDGTAGTGAGLRFTSSGSDSSYSQHIYIASSNITIKWLEIDGTGASSVAAAMHFVSNAGADVGNVHIRNNLMYGLDQKGGGIPTRAVRIETPSDTVTGTCSILNNIIYDIEPSTPSGGDCVGIFAAGGRSENSIYVYNNTLNKIVGTATAGGTQGYGRGIQGGANTYVKNNIVSDVTSTVTEACYFGTFHSSSDYNLSTDDTASGSNSIRSAILNNIYSSPSGTVDLHLKAGSPAAGVGVDLGTSPTGVNIDIDGRDRDAEGDTWDIGADQFVANGTVVAPAVASFIASGVSPTIDDSTRITPPAASFVADAITPTIQFGSSTISPSSASVNVVASLAGVPTGSITVVPTAASFVAECPDPSVVVPAEAITPPAASFVAEAISPTITAGEIRITPAVASMAVVAITPSVVLGSLTLTATATLEAAAISPITTLSGITLIPAAPEVVAATITPTTILGSANVTPAAGTVILSGVDPTVVFSSTTATPAQAITTLEASATAQQNSLTITVTASAAVADTVAPTAVLGNIAMTPNAAAATFALTYAAIIQGSQTVVVAPSAQLVYTATDPTLLFGSTTADPTAAVITTAANVTPINDDITITPAASVVVTSASISTILDGVTITPSAGSFVASVPPVRIVASFDSAALGYWIQGRADYSTDGCLDYYVEGVLDYETNGLTHYAIDGRPDYSIGDEL